MIRSLILSASVIALAGCAGVLPSPEPADALYRFGPLEPVYQLEASVTVREPEASRLLSGRTMAAEDSSGAMRYVRSVQWSDRSTSLLQEAVLDQLGGRDGNVALPAQAGAVTDYEFSWRISDLSLKGDTARCKLEGTLLRGTKRSVYRQTAISTSAEARGRTDASRAFALVDAGRACTREVAAFIADAAKPVED